MFNLKRSVPLLLLVLLVTGGWVYSNPVLKMVFPTAGNSTAVATGGVAVVAVSGPLNGCYIKNPTAATQSLFVDPVAAPNTTEGGTNGVLSPGQQWSCPGPMDFTQTVRVNSTDSAHGFVVVKW